MYRKQNQMMEVFVCLIDAVAVLFSLLIASLLRYHTLSSQFVAENIKITYSVLLVLHVASFYFLKMYDGFFSRGRYAELLVSVKYNLVLVAGSQLLGFGMKQELFVSRLVMFYFCILNVLIIWTVHLRRIYHYW